MGTDIREEDKQMCNRGKKRMEERRADDRLINAVCDGGGSGGWGRRMVG